METRRGCQEPFPGHLAARFSMTRAMMFGPSLKCRFGVDLVSITFFGLVAGGMALGKPWEIMSRRDMLGDVIDGGRCKAWK
jgi:hypothetical protein